MILFSQVSTLVYLHFVKGNPLEFLVPSYNRMAQKIEVRGMSCEGCETAVKEAISSLTGVSSVQVDRETDSATVEGEPDWRSVEQAVTDAEYEATLSES